nr:DUF2946 domain-containing protein [Pararobbsia alpina]
MTFRNRKHLTTWLGLIAMWLIVFAPLVSQLVVSARAHEPVAALCSVVQPGHPEHHSPASLLDACGYCDLLADHIVMPSVPQAAVSIVLLVSVAAVAVLGTRFTPLGAFPSGRPRAPPVFS